MKDVERSLRIIRLIVSTRNNFDRQIQRNSRLLFWFINLFLDLCFILFLNLDFYFNIIKQLLALWNHNKYHDFILICFNLFNVWISFVGVSWILMSWNKWFDFNFQNSLRKFFPYCQWSSWCHQIKNIFVNDFPMANLWNKVFNLFLKDITMLSKIDSS